MAAERRAGEATLPKTARRPPDPCAPPPTPHIIRRVLHTIVETPAYLADARRAGLGEGERERIALALARDPRAGDLIVGTGGARKVRFAGRGKGKGGGYRVITYFGGADLPLFLLNVFSKGERADLSQADRNELRTVLGRIAETYRRR